jgi:hypothetical protein
MQFVGMGRMMGPRGGGDTAFDPASLFAGGEDGFWYDYSDLSTMFTDDAATTPVTADGDPVAVILDKSGNDNHGRQTTAASRPLYKTDGTLHWLQFDNTDDFLVPDNVSIQPGAGTATWSLNYGTQYLGADASVILLGDLSSNAYTLVSVQSSATTTLISPAPASLVSLDIDGVGKTLAGRTWGDNYTDFQGQHVLRTEITVPTAVAWGSPALFRFSATGQFNFGGFCYSTIFIDRALTDGEKASVDTYIAAKSGVSL